MRSEFDIVVYGATGFTGRLVAEYLAASCPQGVRWAMAGRSIAKLEEVRASIDGAGEIALIVADADDPASLAALCGRASVIVTTVGPYQLYGSALVAACARTGTAYVDLCGEPAWMREMIDRHHAEAQASGARIVFSCGFDSIPFDLGVFTLQEEAQRRFGKPASRVKGRVRKLKGGMSGGTIASFQATVAAAGRDPALVKLLTDPFALTPGHRGPAQPRGNQPEHDPDIDDWVAPFMMATINTKNVHRTNFLLGQAWGDVIYDEMTVTGAGETGENAANALAKANPMGKGDLPKPGDGPSKEERETGHYDILFVGLTEDGGRCEAVVTGDRDPGYGSTSKMLAESALCLVLDDAGAGGIWTPGALMGSRLRDRLVAHAGMTFTAG
jgi:short subunit dehydrogenase-like uncharacterized protein